ncbi:hypothetical protein P4233_09730 [Pseudomonas aeruginosa]|nr:hypothetical protein [Pseudomonas aeruginosa]
MHEGCIEQVDGLYRETCTAPTAPRRGRRPACRLPGTAGSAVRVRAVGQGGNENLYELTDFAGYKSEFLNLFGFEVAGSTTSRTSTRTCRSPT